MFFVFPISAALCRVRSVVSFCTSEALLHMIRKLLSFLGIILLLVLAVYGFAMLLGKQLLYPTFSRSAQKGIDIPGLSKGFTPQGVSYVGDYTLVCGYFPGSQSSRIYVVDAAGFANEVLLKKANGDAYTGHAGGLTAAGDYVYVSNASKLFVLRTSDLLAARSGDYVAFIGEIEVACRASFCSSDGEYVYVGEYHAVGYETDESHRVATADGDYQALVFAYRLDKSCRFGVQTSPTMAYAVRDCVQGFAVYNGVAVISCSKGFSSSHLYAYKTGTPDGAYFDNGRSIPMYTLDSAKLAGSLTMPHMSEDVEIRGGNILVGFESSAKKMLWGFFPCSVSNIMIVPMTALVK